MEAVEAAGCKWTGKLSELVDRHASVCEFAKVACSHLGCKSTVLRSNLKEHQLSCSYRLEACTHCRVKFAVVSLAKHVASTCPRFVVTCECGLSHPREEVEAHRAVDCACTLKARFARSKALLERVDELESEKEELEERMAELESQKEDLESEQEKLKERVEELEARVESLSQATLVWKATGIAAALRMSSSESARIYSGYFKVPTVADGVATLRFYLLFAKGEKNVCLYVEHCESSAGLGWPLSLENWTVDVEGKGPSRLKETFAADEEVLYNSSFGWPSFASHAQLASHTEDDCATIIVGINSAGTRNRLQLADPFD